MPGSGDGRRHQGEAAESEDADATPHLLLKYLDVTFATYTSKSR
jgi:hypothetical protein